MQLDSFEKGFSRMFQQICCNFYHFKGTRGQRGIRPKLCFCFYFESDIPKIFPSDIPVVDWFIDWLIDWCLTPTLATCSWNKVNKYQTWLSNVYVWDLLILVTVRVLYMQFKKIYAKTSYSWQIWRVFEG